MCCMTYFDTITHPLWDLRTLENLQFHLTMLIILIFNLMKNVYQTIMKVIQMESIWGNN